jgi:hypothetical protein
MERLDLVVMVGGIIEKPDKRAIDNAGYQNLLIIVAIELTKLPFDTLPKERVDITNYPYIILPDNLQDSRHVYSECHFCSYELYHP